MMNELMESGKTLVRVTLCSVFVLITTCTDGADGPDVRPRPLESVVNVLTNPAATQLQKQLLEGFIYEGTVTVTHVNLCVSPDKKYKDVEIGASLGKVNARAVLLMFKTPDIKKSAEIHNGDQIAVVGFLDKISLYSPPEQKGKKKDAGAEFAWFHKVAVTEISNPATKTK